MRQSHFPCLLKILILCSVWFICGCPNAGGVPGPGGTLVNPYGVSLDDTTWKIEFANGIWFPDIMCLPDGGVILAGLMKEYADLDPGRGVDACDPTGQHGSIIMSRFDSDGNYCWSRLWDGGLGNFRLDLETDSSGNILLLGMFQGTLDMDPGDGVDERTAADSRCGFLVCLDESGSYRFALNWDHYVGDVAVDSSDNFYVAGSVRSATGSVDLDPTDGVDSFSIPSGGFISKFDNDGNYMWSVVTGGFGGSRLAIDPDGNLILAGGLSGTVDLDPGPGVVNHTSQAPQGDLCFVKLDSNGDYVTSESWTANPFSADLKDLAVDSDGNIYMTGECRRIFPSIGCVSEGEYKAFLVSYDSQGNQRYVHDWPVNTNGKELAVDCLGNVFMMGSLSGTVDMDPGGGIIMKSSSGNYGTPFVCKFDTEGNLIQCRTGEENRFHNIGCDNLGNLYVTGDQMASLGAFLLKIGSISDEAASGDVSQDEDSTDIEAPAEWIVSFGSSYTNEETREYRYDPRYRGSEEDYIFDLELDSVGNLYIACVVHATIEFDRDQSVEHPPNRSLLLKFLPDGTFDWLKSWEDGALYSIAIDQNDNIHVAGVAYRCHEFDMDPGPGVDLHSEHGLKQGFAVKLDSSGDYVWGRTFGHEDRRLLCDSIAVDESGNVFVLGNITSGAVSSRTQLFDIDPAPNQEPHGATFLVKLDPDGNLDWRYHWDGEGCASGWTRCYGLVADDDGNVYVASGLAHTESIDFDPGPGVQMADGNGYLLSLDTSGAFRWVWTYSGRDTPDVQALEIGPEDHLFMSGNALYQPSSPSEGTIGGPFIREFDTDGNLVRELYWTAERHTYSGKSADLAVLPSGEVYFTGSSTTWYSDEPATRSDPDNRIFTRDVIVGFNDPAGELETTLWGRGRYLDAGRVIECDADGNIYVGGVAEGIFLLKLKPVEQW